MTTLNTRTELTHYEIKTRELFRDVEWTQGRQMIASVFVAMSVHSLPRERIEEIAAALHNYPRSAIDLSKDLRYLVRIKVLRTRKSSGNHLYEVNY